MSIKKKQKRGFENTSVALIVNILSPESGPISGCYIQWIRGGYFYKKPPSTPFPSVERRSTVYQGLGQFHGKRELDRDKGEKKGKRSRLKPKPFSTPRLRIDIESESEHRGFLPTKAKIHRSNWILVFSSGWTPLPSMNEKEGLFGHHHSRAYGRKLGWSESRLKAISGLLGRIGCFSFFRIASMALWKNYDPMCQVSPGDCAAIQERKERLFRKIIS